VVSLRADGDPTVNVSLCLDEDDTVARIKAARDAALPSASAAMNQLFVTAREQLRRGLRSFDNSASVRFQRLEVTPDGLILRGAIDTKARRPTRVCMQPVVDDAGAGYTAVESWVPGGRIARYVWSLSRLLTRYIGHTGVSFTIPWKVERQPMPPERHRFRLHWGTGLALEFEQYSGVCLSIDGTQINSNGYREDVTGFGSLVSQCLPAVPEPVVVLPPGWEIFHRPLWWPDWPDVAPLDDGILAHVNCLAESLPAEGFATNHLIHFVDWSAPWPIAGLASALTKMRRERFSLATVLVFPEGTLRESRQEMERRLGLDDSVVVDPPVAGRSAVHYQIAEDTQGGWSRVFGTKRTPSSFLINARGEFVWGHAGQVAPEDLAAALDEFLLPAPAPSNKPLEMGIRPGSRLPPDWLDELLVSAGERRLRGRRALVCFWQSWSSPCLRELTRLERLYSEGTEDAVIIGLSGDQTEKPIAAVRDQLGLNFPLLHDAGLQIATRLKVKCWPTTVYISADGIVESIQFGSPPHQPKDSDRSAS
jgi:peroxiredoxin